MYSLLNDLILSHSLKRVYILLLLITLANFFTSFKTNAQEKSNTDTAYVRKLITDFYHTQASVKYIYQCSLNADASAVTWSADEDNGQRISILSLKNISNVLKVTASDSPEKQCTETEPAFSPDGKQIAFLSDAHTENQLQLFIADATTGKLVNAQPLTNFNGYISHVHWSPDGRYVSVLYVEEATRNPNPMAAENRFVGIIDSAVNNNVQRIAIVDVAAKQTRIISPQQLYIFEYNWSPDSKSVAYTSAPPPGDDNWYIAKLYTQSIFNYDTTLIYQPAFQIALPRWSPNGKQLAFIEGLMSDQGGTGGEIYITDAVARSRPKNVTPQRKSTPAWFAWQKDNNILFTEFTGGSVAFNSLNISSGIIKNIWKQDASVRAGNEETSLSIAENKQGVSIAFIKSGWNQLPEVWFGNSTHQQQLTHINSNIQKPVLRTENIEWTNEGKQVQGWLLYPQQYDSSKKYPMLVNVHGGPAWISTPTWSAADFNTTAYTQFDYFIFFPNARGSYGQGENFTLANRRDWGFGDLRDILSGVDAIIKNHSVDGNRLGILGWSYGGFMTMFSITQTNRFKAAVTGAGAANWISYYGQNSIDKWMQSYFNASPYDDPEAYKKVSPVTYIKQAKTPTLVVVGERDGEAPAPQSFEFWHALKELKVPTRLKIYADEGHAFENFDNMIDVSVQTISWFNKYLQP